MVRRSTPEPARKVAQAWRRSASSRAVCQECLIDTNGFRVSRFGKTYEHLSNRGAALSTSIAACDRAAFRDRPFFVCGISYCRLSRSKCFHSACSSAESRAPLYRSNRTTRPSCGLADASHAVSNRVTSSGVKYLPQSAPRRTQTATHRKGAFAQVRV